jgi:type I restriction enzyme, S subunit
MAVYSEVSASLLKKHSGRIDAEYYRPETLYVENIIKSKHYTAFKNLVEDGYRVVYENTKILRSDKITASDCRFVQATNISSNGLEIEVENVGFVSEKDWIRYPKGRIKKGELLIEVKGQAEKVTIVPDDYPSRSLVSGSLFKATISNLVTPEFVFAFFNSKYGKILRDRTKTNTLIAFVSKPELYKIPIPLPSVSVVEEITTLVSLAIKKNKISKSLYKNAQKLIEKELGMDQLALEKSISYETNFSEVVESHRLDAQCFKPQYIDYEKHLLKNGNYDYLRNLLITTLKGKQTETVENGDIEYVSIKDIQGVEIYSREYCKQSPKLRIAQKGDLLLAITGATIGKIGIVSRSNTLAFSGDLLSLKTNKNVDPYYLFAIMSSSNGQRQCQRWITGSTNGHLSPLDVSKFVIPRISGVSEKKVSELIQSSITATLESEELLEKAKKRVEEFIEGVGE